ncbi:hypothetical protein B566_EDAN007784 [Ephemera danica]|nr:hypothetical protein B566_EDAN007784 [Ephemera danica]
MLLLRRRPKDQHHHYDAVQGMVDKICCYGPVEWLAIYKESQSFSPLYRTHTHTEREKNSSLSLSILLEAMAVHACPGISLCVDVVALLLACLAPEHIDPQRGGSVSCPRPPPSPIPAACHPPKLSTLSLSLSLISLIAIRARRGGCEEAASGRRKHCTPVASPLLAPYMKADGCHAQQQYFRIEPRDVKVHEGGEALLECQVANQAGQVQWTKDGFALAWFLRSLSLSRQLRKSSHQSWWQRREKVNLKVFWLCLWLLLLLLLLSAWSHADNYI